MFPCSSSTTRRFPVFWNLWNKGSTGFKLGIPCLFLVEDWRSSFQQYLDRRRRRKFAKVKLPFWAEFSCLWFKINYNSTYIQVFTRNEPQFDRVKGHVRDPSSNLMLLLTSSIIVPSFIILSQRVHELSWERTDRQKDISIQNDLIKCSGEHLINFLLLNS